MASCLTAINDLRRILTVTLHRPPFRKRLPAFAMWMRYDAEQPRRLRAVTIELREITPRIIRRRQLRRPALRRLSAKVFDHG